jgi:hypothetical protein
MIFLTSLTCYSVQRETLRDNFYNIRDLFCNFWSEYWSISAVRDFYVMFVWIDTSAFRFRIAVVAIQISAISKGEEPKDDHYLDFHLAVVSVEMM